MARKETTPKATTPAPATTTPAKKPSAMDLLKKAAKPAAPVAPAKGKQKQIIPCDTPDENTALNTYAAADTVLKLAEANQSAAKQAAHTIFRRKFLERAINVGYMPDNPKLQSDKATANFIVKHMRKFKAVGSDGKPLDVETVLAGMGFGKHIVNKIVGEKDDEGTVVNPGIIKGKESLGLKKFTDLTGPESTPEQQRVAEKIMGLLAEHLDDDEKALALEAGIEYEITDNWQDEAVKFAIDGLNDKDPEFIRKATDRLEALFRVVPPQFVISHLNFSGELNAAFTQMQVPVPVVGKPIVSDSPDGKYRAKTIGTEVHLFLVKPDGEEPVKTKTCKDAGHAENTVKKWWRQPQALADFLSGADANK